MKITTAAVAVLLASIFITACGKKDEAPAEAAPVATAPAEAAPAETAPAETAAPAEAAPAAAPETNPDAPATGGDKVGPAPQN